MAKYNYKLIDLPKPEIPRDVCVPLQHNVIRTVSSKLSTDQENMIVEALDENEIDSFNLELIARECIFRVDGNGDKVFFHKNKPLLLIKKMEFEKTDDPSVFTCIQKFAKLY